MAVVAVVAVVVVEVDDDASPSVGLCLWSDENQVLFSPLPRQIKPSERSRFPGVNLREEKMAPRAGQLILPKDLILR